METQGLDHADRFRPWLSDEGGAVCGFERLDDQELLAGSSNDGYDVRLSIDLRHPVTFTATVVPSSAAGSVQFKDGATNLGAPVAVSGGQATLVTSALLAASPDYGRLHRDACEQHECGPRSACRSQSADDYGDESEQGVRRRYDPGRNRSLRRAGWSEPTPSPASHSTVPGMHSRRRWQGRPTRSPRRRRWARACRTTTLRMRNNGSAYRHSTARDRDRGRQDQDLWRERSNADTSGDQ